VVEVTVLAISQQKQFLNQVDTFAHRTGGRIWPKILFSLVS
jgi:hypothetical protein